MMAIVARVGDEFLSNRRNSIELTSENHLNLTGLSIRIVK